MRFNIYIFGSTKLNRKKGYACSNHDLLSQKLTVFTELVLEIELNQTLQLHITGCLE